MIRITDLGLPLDHPEAALRAALLAQLGVDSAALRSFTVFKRSHDARKKSAITLIYTVDCEVDDEAAVLERHAADAHIKPSPDTRYRFIGHAPADFAAAGRPRGARSSSARSSPCRRRRRRRQRAARARRSPSYLARQRAHA